MDICEMEVSSMDEQSKPMRAGYRALPYSYTVGETEYEFSINLFPSRRAERNFFIFCCLCNVRLREYYHKEYFRDKEEDNLSRTNYKGKTK